ncbi:hypothetical protein H5410_020067 [Solanum commersonii]|uniref:Uncharacterized protein n=1 Tax=Solanum commersonii TaxID=4109 RepID=A0A9J5Z814_SOLCO|nr:hypothetical protein H5410_020067 [Solanum commersonii]
MESVSLSMLPFPSDVVNVNPPPPNTRTLVSLSSCSSYKVFYKLDSWTQRTFFIRRSQEPETFVFPRGLVYYPCNVNHYKQVVALSAFGSVNADTVSLPLSIFGNNIVDLTLTKVFLRLMLAPLTRSK